LNTLKINTNKRYNRGIGRRIQFFLDWISFKDSCVLSKHQPEIRNYFQLKEPILSNCRDTMKNQKTDGKTIIGVHIRRGDYQIFNKGKWFYTDREYCNWMKDINAEKEVRFVLFSDEKVDLTCFIQNGLDATTLCGSAVEDLCCLSLCDYIMGPPSTFSWWAAMYGDKKRLVLENGNAKYSWKDFYSFTERVERGDDNY
jgi:hypothetical protein